jgi:hypothetical protein
LIVFLVSIDMVDFDRDVSGHRMNFTPTAALASIPPNVDKSATSASSFSVWHFALKPLVNPGNEISLVPLTDGNGHIREILDCGFPVQRPSSTALQGIRDFTIFSFAVHVNSYQNYEVIKCEFAPVAQLAVAAVSKTDLERAADINPLVVGSSPTGCAKFGEEL